MMSIKIFKINTFATGAGAPLPIGTYTSGIPGNGIFSDYGGIVLPLPQVLCFPAGKLLA